nr:MAG: hypothetical protein [Caudoviricetes sp.]
MFNKDDMIADLQKNVCVVTFTKVNGDKRILKATLKSDTIPASSNTSSTVHRIPDDVIACYDTENNGWRSFRVDSVIDFIVA